MVSEFLFLHLLFLGKEQMAERERDGERAAAAAATAAAAAAIPGKEKRKRRSSSNSEQERCERERDFAINLVRGKDPSSPARAGDEVLIPPGFRVL